MIEKLGASQFEDETFLKWMETKGKTEREKTMALMIHIRKLFREFILGPPHAQPIMVFLGRQITYPIWSKRGTNELGAGADMGIKDPPTVPFFPTVS